MREDKSVEEATSPDVIVDLYNKQTRKMTSAKERLEAQKKRDNAEDAKEDDTEMKSEEEVDEKAKEWSWLLHAEFLSSRRESWSAVLLSSSLWTHFEVLTWVARAHRGVQIILNSTRHSCVS